MFSIQYNLKVKNISTHNYFKGCLGTQDKIRAQFFLMYANLMDGSRTVKSISWLYPSSLVWPLLTAYTWQASSFQYHLVRFEIPAIMAFRIGAKVTCFSAAFSDMSRNSLVGKTPKTVGTHSEENACWASAGCCIDEVRNWLCEIMKCRYLEYLAEQVQICPFSGCEPIVSIALLL